MYGYNKKISMTTNKADLGVCYQLLCTNLGDGILCTLLSNHNSRVFISDGQRIL